MHTKRKQRFGNNNCTWPFYVSLVAHIIWASLIIYLFLKPEPTYTQRQLVDSPEWWTYDSSTKTLYIHAKTVYIGEKKLERNRLLHPSSGAKLIVHGNVESSSVDILSQILYHGTPLQKTLQGQKGDAGLQGPKGNKGDAGVKGDVGLQGPKGNKGDAGVKGDTGLQGPKGNKGDVGLQGPKGNKGDAGVKGDTGLQGPKGNKGDAGLQGPKGDNGDAGLQGPKGDKGPKGDNGDTGLKGDAGLQGPKGDTGLQGDKGDTGKSGENEWWVFEDGELRVNTSNVYISNLHADGAIIAHGKIVTDKNFEIGHND